MEQPGQHPADDELVLKQGAMYNEALRGMTDRLAHLKEATGYACHVEDMRVSCSETFHFVVRARVVWKTPELDCPGLEMAWLDKTGRSGGLGKLLKSDGTAL